MFSGRVSDPVTTLFQKHGNPPPPQGAYGDASVSIRFFIRLAREYHAGEWRLHGRLPGLSLRLQRQRQRSSQGAAAFAHAVFQPSTNPPPHLHLSSAPIFSSPWCCVCIPTTCSQCIVADGGWSLACGTSRISFARQDDDGRSNSDGDKGSRPWYEL